jgi:nitroreductase
MMDALELLLGRTSALKLTEPAPSEAELDVMLRSAVRAPDHGRLRPWRFVIVPTDKRERFGEVLAEAMHRRDPDAPVDMLQREHDKAMRAPLIVVVGVHIHKGHKIPEIEQFSSAAAATQNIMLAAYAQGYGSMWKTGAPAYDTVVKQSLGLGSDDEIIGFLYLGTRIGGALPAVRPSPQDYVSVWQG